MIVSAAFFDKEPCELAQALLGKVIRHKLNDHWLSCLIIETEAYYCEEKGSHSSLGFTDKRKAMFMPAGTIYMYHARGGDSLNVSAHGEGNAVLIKSGYPFTDQLSPAHTITMMQHLNPAADGKTHRKPKKLCSGQTLLCKSLGLKVAEWDQKQFDPEQLYIDDVGYTPASIVQTTRMGIPNGRDEHLMYRFIDQAYAKYCTNNPLTKRAWKQGQHYQVHHHVPVSC